MTSRGTATVQQVDDPRLSSLESLAKALGVKVKDLL
jgi:hypothetical protein